MREPMFAGSFYPNNEFALNRVIESCFKHKLGPGELPGLKKRAVRAVISPHAGYSYSGPAAAWSYKAIGETQKPDVYFLIGPNHNGSKTALSSVSWRTPLGIVRVDEFFVRSLSKNANIEIDEKAHALEHSLEVQLPFLQFVIKQEAETLRIAPLIIGFDVDVKELAMAVKEVLVDQSKNVVVIASSDFTHYGPAYGYVPFSLNVKEGIYKLDSIALEHIKQLNADGFRAFVEENQATICGFKAIELLLRLHKALGVKKAFLEQYYTSGDLTNYKNSVSYASVVFEGLRIRD